MTLYKGDNRQYVVRYIEDEIKVSVRQIEDKSKGGGAEKGKEEGRVERMLM